MSSQVRTKGDHPPECAPYFEIPRISIVSVEHPCLVKNVERGIEMLGGDKALATALGSNSDKTLSLSFRPNDPTTRSVISVQKVTENVLLKISVPKRTGRKRKRGMNVPFEMDDSGSTNHNTAKYLVRSMTECSHGYDVEAIGNINSTHKWRTIPDYVYSVRESEFLTEIQNKILPQQYPNVKQWTLPRSYGMTNTETIPPPVFSTVSFPNNYVYRQNPAVKAFADPNTGKKTLHNTQAPIRIHTYQCRDNDAEYPTAPPPACPPLSEQSVAVQKVHDMIVDLFEQRPIWTRRALLNNLPDDAPVLFARFALAYVAFAIRSGPWRDTICKLGIDPRKHSSYRKYQTIFLQLVPRDRSRDSEQDEFARNWNRSKDKSSHIFTGNGPVVAADGKIWQLCDLEDPQLKPLVDVPDVFLRSQCETRYFGWYANGTNAKLRVALKAKVDALNNGPPLDASALSRFLELPEDWDGEVRAGREVEETNPMSGYLPKDASRKELEWASAYRAFCRAQDGKIPISGGSGKGRLSKTKPKTRGSFLGLEAEEDNNILPRELYPEDTETLEEPALSGIKNNRLSDGKLTASQSVEIVEEMEE